MLKKAVGIYSLIIGAGMILMWLMFYFTGSISELSTEPARITLHLFAEFATAAALVLSGWGLLKNKKWDKQVYLLATGALLYTLIQSPGYFIQKGEIAFVIMFVLLIIVTLGFLYAMGKSDSLLFTSYRQ